MLAVSCLIAAFVVWLFLKVWTWNYDYWKTKGFPYLEPSFPFGNLKDIVLHRRFPGSVYQEIYRKLAPYPYGGIFRLRTPQLIVKDPEILKHIFVKDFNSFYSRNRLARKEPLADHLFNIEGERWKALRVKLTPTFSSGKLKIMFKLFQDCANQLDQILEEKASKEEIIDMKDLMSRLTGDIIASCAFGLDINSMLEPKNEFRVMINKVIAPTPTWETQFKLASTEIIPGLDNLIKFSLFPDDVNNFFISVVKDTVEHREKNNFKRNDFLDLLIELKNKGFVEGQNTNDPEENNITQDKTLPFEMDINFMAAQCFIFFAAGYETSSSVQSYCLYELALNEEIQDKLRREVTESVAKHGGLSYQAIQEMLYLDQVVSETMRKYPTLFALQRFSTKRYKMPDKDLILEEGTKVIIPIYAIHHDPDYFPEPEKFDPDRFSQERKSSIKPFTYFPFGEGPRHCIGMRFGLLQTKVGVCTILLKYSVQPCSETTTPLKFSSSLLITTTEGPIKLRIKKVT